MPALNFLLPCPKIQAQQHFPKKQQILFSVIITHHTYTIMLQRKLRSSALLRQLLTARYICTSEKHLHQTGGNSKQVCNPSAYISILQILDLFKVSKRTSEEQQEHTGGRRVSPSPQMPISSRTQPCLTIPVVATVLYVLENPTAEDNLFSCTFQL